MRRLFGVLMGLALSLLWSPQLFAYTHKIAPATGRIYHWKRSNLPIKLHINSTVPNGVTAPLFQQSCQSAVSTWNAVQCALQPLLKIESTTATAVQSKRDGLSVISFITVAAQWNHQPGELAVTTHFYNLSTGEIVEADLEINAWNLQFKWGDGKAVTTAYDLQAMVTHELGHFLGLDHTADTKASMHASANPGETEKRFLNTDDTTGICNIYPQLPCQDGQNLGAGNFCYNGRVTTVCSAYHDMCKKCDAANKHQDCRGATTFCLNLNDGQYCGFDCTKTNVCPTGYECRDVAGDNGKIIGKNCLPKSLECESNPPPDQFPCCLEDDHCLPPYTCVSGNCVRAATCSQAGGTCKDGKGCCTGLVCINDGTGGNCRNTCDPLSPKCLENLRCAFLQGSASGACVPPNGGGREGDACSAQKGCEHQLQCHPRDNKCRLVCRPGQNETCPNGYRCIDQNNQPPLGLCEKANTGNPCKTVGDCAAGQVCKNATCSSCQNNTDCPTHYQCNGGACLAPCNGTNTSCPPGHACVANLCQPSTTCVFNRDCPQGNVCTNGTCRPPDNTKCTQDSECQSGYKCTNGSCVDPCNNSCTSGQICLLNRCAPVSCTSDDQCGQGLLCQGGRCQVKETNCGGKGPCPQGQICAGGRCLASIGYPCTGNEVCASGFCVTSGKLKLCSQQCNTADPKSCPNGYNCAAFPNIGLACWPGQYTTCKEGRCTPNGEGCGCSSIYEQPDFAGELFFLLFCLFLVRRQRVFRVQRMD